VKEQHKIVVKAQTLEMWCYSCSKWLGQEGEKLLAMGQQGPEVTAEGDELRHIEGVMLELDVVKEIARRLGMSQEVEECNRRRKAERGWKLNHQGEYFLISVAWYAQWRLFLIGDIDTPGPVLNNDLEEVLLLYNAGEVVAPPRLGTDYYVVMRETWEYLVQTYGGGPAILGVGSHLPWEMRLELIRLRIQIREQNN